MTITSQSNTDSKLVIGYIRVSTDGQEESGNSLQVQRETIMSYARFKSLQVSEILQDVVSGSTVLSEREQGSKLMTAVRTGHVSDVIFTKLDRGFRNVIDCLATIKELDDNGVTIHIIDMGGTTVDTKSAIGRFIITTMSAVAELERETIKERIKGGIRKSIQNGNAWANRPYGFTHNIQRGHAGELVEVPEEQVVVKQILKLRSDGLSYDKIAKLLNSRQIPARGKQWYPTSVKNVCDYHFQAIK